MKNVLGCLPIIILLVIFFAPVQRWLTADKKLQGENIEVWGTKISFDEQHYAGSYAEKPHFGHGLLNGMVTVPICVRETLGDYWDEIKREFVSWHWEKKIWSRSVKEIYYDAFYKNNPGLIAMLLWHFPWFLIAMIFVLPLAFVAFIFWAFLYLIKYFFWYLLVQFIFFPWILFHFADSFSYWLGLLIAWVLSGILMLISLAAAR